MAIGAGRSPRLRLGGVRVTTLGTTATALLPQGMASTSTDIYFVGYVARAWGRAGASTRSKYTARDHPNLEQSLAEPAGRRDAATGSNVYWTDMAAGAVYSMPLGGGWRPRWPRASRSPAHDGGRIRRTSISPRTRSIYEVPIGGASAQIACLHRARYAPVPPSQGTTARTTWSTSRRPRSVVGVRNNRLRERRGRPQTSWTSPTTGMVRQELGSPRCCRTVRRRRRLAH